MKPCCRLFSGPLGSFESFNEQPWRFILARRSDTRVQTMLDCFRTINRSGRNTRQRLHPFRWQPLHHNHYHTATPSTMWARRSPTQSEATAHDIYLHQLGGFHIDKAREHFAISDEYEPVSIIVLGYAGDISDFRTNLRQREAATNACRSTTGLFRKFGQSNDLPQQ